MLDVLDVLDVERRCPGKFLLGQPAFAPERRDPTADPAEGTLQLRAGPCLGAARWRTAFGL